MLRLFKLLTIYSLLGWVIKGDIVFPGDTDPIPGMKPTPTPSTGVKNLPCKTLDNQNGICTQLQDCPIISDNLPNSNPVICPNSIGYLVYICCPNDIATNTIRVRRQTSTTRAVRGPTASSRSLIVSRNECAAVSKPSRNSFLSSLLSRREVEAPVGFIRNVLKPVRTFFVTDIGSNIPTFHRQNQHQFVIGGTNAAEGSWPWMAAIYKVTNGQKVFQCGGSILSSEWILSAAHCFPDRNQNFVIRAGVTDLMQENPVDTPTSKIFVHPSYAPPVLYNDIALVKLGHSLRFSEVVKPICLPSGEAVMNQFVSEDVRLAGWGSTQFGGKPTSALQEVVLPVIKLDKCEEVYRKFHALDISFPNGLTDGILCAGNKGDSKDACQGDSGGPLVKSSSDGKWEVIGVVSTGIGCGKIDVPGVYTRVGHYMDWLLKTIENN